MYYVIITLECVCSKIRVEYEYIINIVGRALLPCLVGHPTKHGSRARSTIVYNQQMGEKGPSVYYKKV